jgi:hypothetical protein
MVETQKNTQPQPVTAQETAEGNSLLPMLIAGLALIILGYIGIMIFV